MKEGNTLFEGPLMVGPRFPVPSSSRSSGCSGGPSVLLSSGHVGSEHELHAVRGQTGMHHRVAVAVVFERLGGAPGTVLQAGEEQAQVVHPGVHVAEPFRDGPVPREQTRSPSALKEAGPSFTGEAIASERSSAFPCPRSSSSTR